MASQSPAKAKDDQELMSILWSDEYRFYPERAVMFGMPWGVPGTPLEKKKGPRAWQMRRLKKWGARIRANAEALKNGAPLTTCQQATCSGRGIGKSALYGMESWFHMSCWPGSSTIVAANGEAQLDSKTFPEIKKWFTVSINAHWFDLAARSVRPADWFKTAIEKQLKIDCGYYYVQGQLWVEEKPDSFAGAHNPLGCVVLFDEASGIPQAIWTVAKGFFTEQDCITRAHMAFSNGRKNTGPFFECFHKLREYWDHENIDSRTVEGVDVADLLQIIKQHGEDSDEARIEVRGLFPHQGDRQLISRLTIENAALRQVEPDDGAPLTMAVDVARFGENKSVISFKKGRDARSIPWQKYKKIRVTELARHCIDAIDKYKPDAVFIDANGVGGPLADILNDAGYKVIEVNFGEAADDYQTYEGKRTECWCLMADWLEIGAVPDDPYLKDDLATPEYELVGRESKKFLEPKSKTEARGFASPDEGDSLALHFARRIARADLPANTRRRKNMVAKDVDYDVLS